MELKYFFDTYALIEILKKNKNYLPYKNIKPIITKLNLMELHYSILKEVGKDYAEIIYQKFLPFVVEISDKAIKLANEFKLKHKKRKLSYVDCLGYILAKIYNVKFLTGDKEFKGMENVEFVR